MSSSEEEDVSDPTEFLALKSKAYQEQSQKLENLRKGIHNLYNGIMHQSLEIKGFSLTPQLQAIPYDKKGNINAYLLLNQLTVMMALLFRASKNYILDMNEKDQGQEYDETLLRLEKEIRMLIKSQEKLGIYAECAKNRVEEMKKKVHDLETEINQFKSVEKQKKPTRIQEDISQQQCKSIPNLKLSKAMVKIQLSRSQSASKQYRRQTKPINQAEDMQTQKLQFEKRRMAVLKEQLDQENDQLKKELVEVNLKLKNIKMEKQKNEISRWKKEALSDKNPYLMAYFKKKNEAKDRQIKLLNKNMKKFAIVEKKLYVKERAFEVERASYQDRLLYLTDQVSTKLNQIKSIKGTYS